MYKVNGELSSCDITDSGIVPSREGDIQNFAQIVLLNGLSKLLLGFQNCFLLTQSTLLFGETSPLITGRYSFGWFYNLSHILSS